MKKCMRFKFLSGLASISMMAVAVLANWPRSFISHQPKEPVDIKKLRKF